MNSSYSCWYFPGHWPFQTEVILCLLLSICLISRIFVLEYFAFACLLVFLLQLNKESIVFRISNWFCFDGLKLPAIYQGKSISARPAPPFPAPACRHLLPPKNMSTSTHKLSCNSEPSLMLCYSLTSLKVCKEMQIGIDRKPEKVREIYWSGKH